MVRNKQVEKAERNDWMTPFYIKALASAFFNEAHGMDTLSYFDPCPPNYDELDHNDGLTTSWPPCAFINPPFNQYKKWVQHGVRQPKPQIWLGNTNHDTEWFALLYKNTTALILLDHRVDFINPDTLLPNGDPKRCNFLAYRGDKPTSFLNHFSGLGYGVYAR